MQKLIALFCLIAFMGNAFAGSCVVSQYSFSADSIKRNSIAPQFDEYLWPAGTNYELIVRDRAGRGYRCGHDIGNESASECDGGAFIYMHDDHRYTGDAWRPATVYECLDRTIGRDHNTWKSYEIIDVCSDRTNITPVQMNNLPANLTLYKDSNGRAYCRQLPGDCGPLVRADIQKVIDGARAQNDTEMLALANAALAECGANKRGNNYEELMLRLPNNVNYTSIWQSLSTSSQMSVSSSVYNSAWYKTNIASVRTAVEAIDKAMGAGGIIASDLTVWRNAQGKFNTTRLAVDLGAGVVLGTAGGLITSSVVKKNQLSEGWEDLSCGIGGQTVAGWGDEFVVGIR